MKRLITTLLATLVALTSMMTFVGCGGGGERPDPNRTQIYVSVQNCGLGYTFLDSLKTKYEALHPEIQIMKIPNGAASEAVAGEIANNGYDIYMFTHCDPTYYLKLNAKASDYFEDITDVVTADGANSIHNRLFDSVRNFYNIGDDQNPKYFHLPWYTSYYGTVYDVDLFEERHLLATDPEFDLVYEGYDGEMYTEDDTWGPDGIEGSFDDGLPATIGDLMALIGKMKTPDADGKKIIPYCWTSFDGYSSSWLETVWAAYEGSNYELLTDFDGVYKYNDKDTNEYTELEINADNGYVLAYQNGKYAALKFAKYIVENNHYLASSFNTSSDNEITQINYLNSADKKERIAFMMEGSWWENEAKSTFNSMATYKDPKYAYGVRKFGLMPFPRFVGAGCEELGIPEQVNPYLTIGGGVGSVSSGVALSKKSTVKEEAKEFIKFMYSDAMCADFTIEAGVSKPLKYDMGDRYGDMTYYQKQLYQIAQLSTNTEETNVQVVNGLNRSKYIIKNPTLVEQIATFVAKKSATSNQTTKDPFHHFWTNSTLTAEDYFNNVKSLITQNKWNTEMLEGLN